MTVPYPSGRALWPGTHASIPIGWSRDSNVDNRFLQGSNAAYPGPANGGAASHTHTANTHTHIGNAHSHNFSAGSGQSASTVGISFGLTAMRCSNNVHTHAPRASPFTAITYQNTIITINTDNTIPPFVRLIVIQPDDANQGIPINGICFTDETTLPTGFVKTDGTGGTLNLNGRFVYGATSPAGGGGGMGGSATHTHTTVNHTHIINVHTHAVTSCGNASGPRIDTSVPTTGARMLSHHNVSLDGKLLVDLSTDAVTVNAASTEPAYIELLGIQNTSASDVTSKNVIIPYVGTVASIPEDWAFCDGTGGTPNMVNRQVKITTVNGNIGNVGGSNTHTHTTVAHGHTHTGNHDHTTTITQTGNLWVRPAGIQVLPSHPLGKHTHIWTVSLKTPTLQNATVTMSTDDGRREYRTVIFIKRIHFPTVHIREAEIREAAIAA